MAFRHRKILEYSIDLNATKFCELFCVPNNNIDGYCQRSCVQFPPTSLPDSIPNLHHRYKSPNLHLHLHLYLYLSISFALLATALFLFACFLIRRCLRIRRSSTPPENGGDRELRDEERGPVVDHPIWYIRTVGLQPSIINAIAVCKYRKSDGVVDGTECSVCLSEFEEDETLRLLPKCSHAFHIPCIDTWLRSHTNCPNCRTVIFSPPIPVPAAEQETDGTETIQEESEPESAPLDRENEIGDTRGGDEDFQRIRRSVSASIMSVAIVNDAYPDQYTELENSVPKNIKGSQSLIRLIDGGRDGNCDDSQSGIIRPCLGKRSFSCSILIKVVSK